MVRFQPINNRIEPGVGPSHCRKQGHILGPVMSMNEAAVLQAVHSQLEQRTLGAEPSDLLTDLLGGGAGGDRGGESLAGPEVAPEQPMDPLQLRQNWVGSSLVRRGQRQRLRVPAGGTAAIQSG